MVIEHKNYTSEQAEALDRAMEAQYDADKKREVGGYSEERQDWRRIRDLAATWTFSLRRRRAE
jgi:hypothetical protein